MRINKNRVFILFILLAFILNSCNNEDPQYVPPTLVAFPETGLLGQPITIKIDNFEMEKLQVFFDAEEAPVNYVSETEISVVVPRNIKRYNPVLKIIDLNNNKTVVEKSFSLKKPVISNYSSETVTFNETFTIYGENFDRDPEFVSVYVNNEIAKIISTGYNKIEIQIPTKIAKADLEIKVNSQLRETVSLVPLVLKAPIIKSIRNSAVWLQQILYLNVENFNPDNKFGELFINGIPSNYFEVKDKTVEVTIPPGPFKDFKITNITYKTAGLTTSYDYEVKILSDFILVDHIDNANVEHTIFKHNNKAYVFKSVYDIYTTDNRSYTLLEFSPITEKWTEVSDFKYSGFIVDAVYDGDDTVYLYKMSVATQSFTMTKLNLETFKETAVDLPGNKIFSPILFAYQDNLYLLSGMNNIDGTTSTRNQKYKYSKAANRWTELPTSAFSTIPLVTSIGGGKCKYLFNAGNLYLSLGISYKTYKITPSLAVTEYPYRLFLDYGNAILGKNVNYNQLLFNIETNANKTLDLYSLFGYSEDFFTLNNEIYYLRGSWSVYYQNMIYTQKLRKEILNGIL